MSQSLEYTYQEVRVRAGGVCEGEGCDEVHLTPAKHYKGKVILTINHAGRKIINDPDKMKALCFRCSGHLDRMKMLRKKGPTPMTRRRAEEKRKKSGQMDLMELL